MQQWTDYNWGSHPGSAWPFHLILEGLSRRGGPAIPSHTGLGPGQAGGGARALSHLLPLLSGQVSLRVLQPTSTLTLAAGQPVHTYSYGQAVLASRQEQVGGARDKWTCSNQPCALRSLLQNPFLRGACPDCWLHRALSVHPVSPAWWLARPLLSTLKLSLFSLIPVTCVLLRTYYMPSIVQVLGVPEGEQNFQPRFHPHGIHILVGETRENI